MDYSNAISVFYTGLGFMHGLGFNGPRISIDTTKLAGDSLLLTYEAQPVGRQVEISYLAGQRGGPAAIVIFLVASNGRRFSIEDWLNANGIGEKIVFSTLKDPGLHENLFIARFCQDWKKLCYHELHGILTGKTWQDVPIDWKGYR